MERLGASYYGELRDKITMNNLKKIIEDRDFSVVNVATKCKISDSTLYNYFKSQRLPSITTLVELANTLNCNMDFLLDRTDNPININDVDKFSNDKNTKILIDNILSLNDDKRKLVDAYVKGLLNI